VLSANYLRGVCFLLHMASFVKDHVAVMTNRAILIAATCGLIAASASPAHADASATAQLAVGVTVSRSCRLDATPSSTSSSMVRLDCAAGAADVLGKKDETGTINLRIPTTPAASSQNGLRIATVQF
jgi:hypothetical protein